MNSKFKLVLFLVVAIVALDQATKAIVDRSMMLNHSVPVIDGIFSLTYIRNTGAAFGFLARSGEFFRRTFLIGFSIAAIGFIVVMLRRLPQHEKLLTVALGFILGGAIGNLIDRLLYGEVIDFLDFYWSYHHWPAFNVADSFITVGVVVILFRLALAKGDDPFAPRERIS
ncbi:MAG TPA: signal peptidase II [Candidatus Binatia bacterium]|nr:signal peptidase II [Candidatus Binatia bacterium]